ncbi:MAG: glycosyltransferase family 4 protein [Anaerolineae bacterium]|nr:glycosyltransferase family 4 protein [Anaerolineae bacterium]
MKIAIFHNIPSGGAKRALFEWTRRLAGQHEIDVYSLATADHAFCDIRPFAAQHHVFEFAPRSLFNSPFGRLNQFQRWRDLGDLERINRRIAGQINQGGYDVLFANTCIFTFIPALLQYVNIPSVYYLHEPFGSGFYRSFERPYLKRGGWRESLNRLDPLIELYQSRLDSIQRRSVRKTTRLLSNSHFTRERIRQAFGVDAAFSPYGVDLTGFHPVEGSRREEYVVSVGEMSPRKGFDFVVKSLGMIPAEQRPPLKLACNMVHEDELAYIQDLARQNGVQLEVLAGVKVDGLRDLYSRARLCVYAPVMEPFGLVPLEAMACGTPVVGVREGGVQESILHELTGLLVEREAQQFGAAIQHLLANPELAETYGQNGREHLLKNWTWDRSVSILESHLADCAGLRLNRNQSTSEKK